MARAKGRGMRGESLAPRPCSLVPHHVLVMARLDARAAVAQSSGSSFRVSATVRGPTKRNGVGHNDAWRVAGSTVTDGCHAPAQSVSALSTRLVRVRPLVY